MICAHYGQAITGSLMRRRRYHPLCRRLASVARAIARDVERHYRALRRAA